MTTHHLLLLALSHFVCPVILKRWCFLTLWSNTDCLCPFKLQPAERSAVKTFGYEWADVWSHVSLSVKERKVSPTLSCVMGWWVFWGVYILVALSGSFHFMYFYCCWKLEALRLASLKTIFSSMDRPSWQTKWSSVLLPVLSSGTYHPYQYRTWFQAPMWKIKGIY